MKAQILNGKIVGFGDIQGTVEQGVYEVSEASAVSVDSDFEIVDGILYFMPKPPDRVSAAIESWQGRYTDYKQAREAAKRVVSEIGFANLTLKEKRTAAEWFAVSIAEIDQVLSLDEKIAAGKPFNLNSIASRSARLEASMRYARNVVPYEDLMGISIELDQSGLEALYINKGLEGTMMVNYEGRPDSTGLYDYLFGTGGFTGAGLPSKNIVFMHGLTLEGVTNRLKEILIDGIYE